jgi:hypothetical protein
MSLRRKFSAFGGGQGAALHPFIRVPLLPGIYSLRSLRSLRFDVLALSACSDPHIRENPSNPCLPYSLLTTGGLIYRTPNYSPVVCRLPPSR